MKPLRKRCLFEFEDLSWFPDRIRRSMLDYLEFIFSKSSLYAPASQLIVDCLQKTGANAVVDLCSGGGGPMIEIQKNIHAVNPEVSITLSDRFPNLAAFEKIHAASNGRIGYSTEPVDACNVPPSLNGLRTCFSALHHFNPEEVNQMLTNAANAKQPIAIFDGGGNKLLLILGIVLIHPLILFFCTPFLYPFRISRLVFTYLIPIIPLCIIWDGVISVLNLYSPSELKQLTELTGETNFQWSTGALPRRMGMDITFIIGLPKKNS